MLDTVTALGWALLVEKKISACWSISQQNTVLQDLQRDVLFFSVSKGAVNFEEVIAYLEQSCRHLESLADPLIYELTEHDEVQ